MISFKMPSPPPLPELVVPWRVIVEFSDEPHIVTASGDTVLASSEWLVGCGLPHDTRILQHIVDLHNNSLPL